MTGQVDGFEYSPLLPINFFCSSHTFKPSIVGVKTPRSGSQIGRNEVNLKQRSNWNQIVVMVEVVFKKGDRVNHISMQG